MGKRREKSKPVHEPREDLLSALVHGCLGEFPDRRHLLYRAELAGLAMRRWIANSKLTANQSDKRLRVLRDRDYQLSAVATIASEQNPGPEPACLRIGQAGTADFSELRPLAERAAELLGVSSHSAHVLIQSARRVPVERSPGASRFGHANERPLARLDRVDALTTLWEPFPVPRARTLLVSAQLVLGHVLRDAALLKSLLSQIPTSGSAERRMFVVALGLLGEAPRVDEACLEDVEDAAAWALATILTFGFSAEQVLAGALRSVAGPARRLIDTALLRVSAGYLFSAIG